MKKTLIFGLALAFGLSACEPIPQFGEYAYIIAKYDGKVVGDCATNTWENEALVAAKSNAVVAAEKGKTYKVTIETTFPIWSLEHLYHKVKITDGAGNVLFPLGYAQEAGAYDIFFELKPKNGPNAGDRILFNDFVKLTYRCIFAKWGYIDEDGMLAKKDGKYLPAVKMGLYTYELEVERTADVTAQGGTVEYHIYIEGRFRAEPEKTLFQNIYQPWFSLASISPFFADLGAPKYTGFKLTLPSMAMPAL